jgi:hypothetical protein
VRPTNRDTLLSAPGVAFFQRTLANLLSPALNAQVMRTEESLDEMVNSLQRPTMPVSGASVPSSTPTFPASCDRRSGASSGDWCRYCGARIASGFNRGPWGSRMLCTPHYVKWKDKSLNLSSYKV